MLKTLFFILKNIGYHLCIDETVLPSYELYTISLIGISMVERVPL